MAFLSSYPYNESTPITWNNPVAGVGGWTTSGIYELVSPTQDAGASNETNHFKVTVTFTAAAGGDCRLSIGYYTADDFSSATTALYGDLTSGVEAELAVNAKSQRYCWVRLRSAVCGP